MHALDLTLVEMDGHLAVLPSTYDGVIEACAGRSSTEV